MRRSPRFEKPLLLVALVPLLALGASNQGIIHGTVHDDFSRPIPNVKVTLSTGNNQKVDQHVTDADGHFDFEQVPFGAYEVLFEAPDGRMDERDLQLTSGDVVELKEVMPVLQQEVVVTAPKPKAPPPPTVAASTSALLHESIQSLPRGDTASVNEILSTQPGFVYDAFGNLFIRGNHANIQYQLDGVPLPDSVNGLFGGFLSPKLIQNMEIVSGGLSAEYGDRLAGVVNLNSRKPSDQGEGQAELVYGAYNTINPSAFYGRKMGKLTFFAGGSFKSDDRALDPPAFDPILNDHGDEERGFLKADYDFNDRDHLSALLNFSRNNYHIPLDPTATPWDPNLPNGGRVPDAFGNPAPAFIPLDTDATETEHDEFGLLSYRHDFGPNASIRTSGYYRHSDGIYFGDPYHALGPGADPCRTDAEGNLTCASASDVTRIADHVGFDGDYILRLGDKHVVKVGAKVDQLLGNTGFTSFTRNDTLQAPDPSLIFSGTDRALATQGGAFAQDRVNVGKWAINGGVRFDFQKVAFDGSPAVPVQTGVSPRLGAAYSFTPNVVGHAYAAVLWQPPPVLDTPAAARQLGVIAPNAPVIYDLKPEQDEYSEVGISARVRPQLTVTANVWGRLVQDQLDDVEVGNTNVVTPYNFKQGRAAGVEGSADFVLSEDFNAFGNVSLETAQGRGIATATYLFSRSDLANTSWQLLDHVQTWTANAGLAYHDGPSMVSGELNYGSGLRTGRNNNEHVPGHVQVDMTLAHHFLYLPFKPEVALDVVNLFDNHFAYRLSNGFNGSHWAPGRSAYLRVTTEF